MTLAQVLLAESRGTVAQPSQMECGVSCLLQNNLWGHGCTALSVARAQMSGRSSEKGMDPTPTVPSPKRISRVFVRRSPQQSHVEMSEDFLLWSIVLL